MAERVRDTELIESLEEELSQERLKNNRITEEALHVIELLASTGEHKIESIKAHRSLTGYGLKESKDWIEAVPRIEQSTWELDNARRQIKELELKYGEYVVNSVKANEFLRAQVNSLATELERPRSPYFERLDELEERVASWTRSFGKDIGLLEDRISDNEEWIKQFRIFAESN